MFRQVVMHRWAASATDEDRAGFRAAVEALRSVPEVASLRYGDDAGRFEGNHDFVVVLDFADFDAARRYVDSPAHRSFIDEFAGRLSTSRTIVQHEWGGVGVPVGVHHLRIPVSDVAVSSAWYQRALGFTLAGELRSPDGSLRGADLELPSSDLGVALRLDPVRAGAFAGVDLLCLSVATRADLDLLVERLDELGIKRGEPDVGARSAAVNVADPDGVLVRLHTLV